MTTPYTSEEIRHRLENLSPRMREIVYGPAITEAVERVGTARRLHIDQIGALEVAAINMIIGIVEPQDFASTLEDDLNLDEASALGVAHDLDAELFQKIRESMKEGYEKQDKKEEAIDVVPQAVRQAPAPVPTPAAASAVSAPNAAPTSALPVETHKELESGTPATTPAPAALMRPTMSVPKTVDIGITQGVARGVPGAAKNYATDPYREPIG